MTQMGHWNEIEDPARELLIEKTLGWTKVKEILDAYLDKHRAKIDGPEVVQ